MNLGDEFPALIETFFTDRLMRQRRASPHTVASYSDTFRLLLVFAELRLKKKPSNLTLDDLAAPFLCEFLDYLENQRGNTARSRNVRLAAIRSFFQYAALHCPARSSLIQRVLAIPNKRYDKNLIAFLSESETNALLAAVDARTWAGRRDRTLLLLAMQTGLRVSELIGLCCDDIVLGRGAYVHCMGKGRKERCAPLLKEVADALRAWRQEHRGSPKEPLFPSVRGGAMSRDCVESLLAKYVARAAAKCPSLSRKRISPHVLRHTAAMRLRHSGIDLPTIALLLGHESVETTQIYTHADLSLTERALSMTPPLHAPPARFRPTDRTLAFLKSL